MQYRTGPSSSTDTFSEEESSQPIPSAKDDVLLTSRRHSQEKSSQKRPWLSTVLLCLVLLIVAGGVWTVFFSRSNLPSYIKTNKYQTVELANNHAYYGKITKMTDTEIILSDVFYIQAPTQTDETKTDAKFELIKIGKEMAGAEDTILINRSQVVLVENLSDDGQVVQQIKAYHKQNKS